MVSKNRGLVLFEHLKPSLAASNDHLAWNRGEGSFPPKLLLISMILDKFSWCMLILSLEINLGEIGVKVERFKHGTELG